MLKYNFGNKEKMDSKRSRDDELTILRYDPANIGTVIEELAELYDRDFVDPEIKSKDPEFYSRSRFRKRVLEDYATSPRFETVVARAGDRIVGFVSAANLIPNTRWWKVVVQPLPDQVTWEDGRRTVAIFDLLVAREFRGKGVGSRLHSSFLERREEERVTLLSSPPQQPAYSIWLHWGYEVIGKAEPVEGGPVLDVFLRPRILQAVEP